MNPSKIFLAAGPERREPVTLRGHTIGHGAQLQALRLGDRRKVVTAQADAASRVVAVNRPGETNRQLAARLRAPAEPDTKPAAAPKRTRKKAAVAVEG